MFANMITVKASCKLLVHVKTDTYLRPFVTPCNNVVHDLNLFFCDENKLRFRYAHIALGVGNMIIAYKIAVDIILPQETSL